MRTLLAGVALSLIVSAAARADPPKTEISFLGGASLLDVTAPRDDLAASASLEGLSMGGSFLLGFRVGRLVGERTQIEAAFIVAPSHELTSESPLLCAAPVCPQPPPTVRVQTTLTAYHYRVGLAFDLTRGPVRPFLAVSVGGVTYDAEDGGKSNLALAARGGLKIYFGRLGLLLEVGDEVVPNHFLTNKAEHDIQLDAGFVLRLP